MPCQPVRIGLTVVLAGLMLVSGGCKSWSWTALRGEGLTDELAEWSSGLRPKSSDTAAGTSEKARQIERNLGYQ